MKRKDFIKGSAILGASPALDKLVLASGMTKSTSVRKVRMILNADRTKVGTLPILRAFSGKHKDYVSPFVLFDEFGPVELEKESHPLRVDAHPHAGVTPTTYFLEGSGHHKDSLNYDFQIKKGDFMLFSSGSGAIHMEESGQSLQDHGGIYHGFQIWLNTPKKYKWEKPFTKVYSGEDLSHLDNEQFEANVILGKLFEAKSSVETFSPAFYYHIKLKANGRIDIPSNPNHNVFVYAIKGNTELEGKQSLEANQIALYERGESLVNLFSAAGSELLVLGGEPLDEIVYSYGPFVMNSAEEINQCIANYHAGKMGNPDLVNQ